MFTFSMTSSQSLDTIWRVLGDPANLPRWDAGTLSATRLRGGEWEVRMRPLTAGSHAVSLRGKPAEERGNNFARISTKWLYADGTFAAEDEWSVVEVEGRRLRRVTYTLHEYALPDDSCCCCCCDAMTRKLVVDPALRAYGRKDVQLLRALFP